MNSVSFQVILCRAGEFRNSWQSSHHRIPLWEGALESNPLTLPFVDEESAASQVK